MEHLTFIPDGPSETVHAARAASLSQDWTAIRNLMPFQPPLTPWLGFEHEDCGSYYELSQYPVARGWTAADIWKGQLRNSHPSLKDLTGRDVAQRVAAMLQSWFYYGFLETVVSKHISISYFAREAPDGALYIYSRNLHFCLQAWTFKVRVFAPDQKIKENMRTYQTLVLVSDWLKRLNSFANPELGYFYTKMESEYPGFGELISMIIPSIVRLGEAINHARTKAFKELASGLNWHYPDKPRRAQEAILLRRGWCPFTLKHVQTTCGFSTFDWLTTLPLKPAYQAQEHGKCSENECLRNNIDVATYKTRHYYCNGRCSNTKPDINQVLQILRKGDIPVSYINQRGNISITSQSTQKAGTYVAFSHMWADGLGSTTEAGIPVCQALRLLNIAQRATQKPAPGIWIDSLCIPQEPDARHNAIVAMRDTYANASEVIVLDHGMQQTKPSTSSEALMCAIYTSGWMQRLWTYQEALLARKLTFDMEDGLFTLQVNSLITRNGPTMPTSVCIVWSSIVAQLIRLLGRGPETRNFSTVGRDLNWRSTSRKTDEVLAFAGILGLDVRIFPKDLIWKWFEEEKARGTSTIEQLEREKEDRMRALQEERMVIALTQLQWLPLDILFLQGPKISAPPFRWAPRTCMTRSPLRMSLESKFRTARCDVNGLHGEWLFLTMRVAWDADFTTIRYVGSVKTKSVYRVFCKEGWPKPPKSSRFDAVIIEGDVTQPLDVGVHRQGLAVLRQPPGDNYSTEILCQAVGQVLVEKLRLEEALDRNPSIMFAEPREGITSGELECAKLHIS